MINISDKTHQKILQEELQNVSNTLDKREGSLIYTSLSAGAYALEQFYIALALEQQQTFIATAGGEYLDNWAIIAGITRKAATSAVRLGVFNIDVPIGSRFSTPDNALDFTATEKIDAGQFQITCDTPGSAGNDYTGAILPITTIQGLTSAQITNILIPGQDEETDESLRTRILDGLNNTPFGGNIADYKTKILALDGVGAVQVYPTWNGGGTVKCSILGADFSPASPELIEEVQNAVDPPPNQGLGYGTAPIGAQVTISTATALTIDISAQLTLAQGYDIGQVQGPIEAAIGAYISEISQAWGTPIPGQPTGYSLSVYVARVISAILTVTGVINATDVQLNGGDIDITLTETSALQQIPQLGTVTLSV